MKRTDNSTLKLLVLIAYIVVFYSIWTIWEFLGKPAFSSVIGNEYISQFIKSGVIKNLVWTLPSVLLVYYFKDDAYVGLKDMFTRKVNSLKYLPIFLVFTIYLLVGAVLQKGNLSISETFSADSIIIVLFVGITEEMVFRGWLLNFIVSDSKKWGAVIINSLMFLFIHFPKWIYEGHFIEYFQNLGFLSPIILGIIFCWTFIKSKSIWIPILLHMYWDLLMFLFY